MTNKPTWEIEFNENWDGASSWKGTEFGVLDEIYEDTSVTTYSKEGIKQFISTKLAEQRKEIAEEIEQKFYGANDVKVQDIINLIKQ